MTPVPYNDPNHPNKPFDPNTKYKVNLKKVPKTKKSSSLLMV